MLPKARRVSGAQFPTVLSRSRSYHGRSHTLRIHLDKAGASRFSAVVPKAVYKRAVDRNRLRRQIYGFIASVTPKMPATTVIFVKKEAKSLKIEDFLAELQENLAKAGIV